MIIISSCVPIELRNHCHTLNYIYIDMYLNFASTSQFRIPSDSLYAIEMSSFPAVDTTLGNPPKTPRLSCSQGMATPSSGRSLNPLRTSTPSSSKRITTEGI